jgi:hypothetical protein
MPSPQAMTHVAWSCDGKKLAAVGIDKVTRVWSPEKSVRHELRILGGPNQISPRWNLEPHRCSQEAILMMSIIYHGIRHTQSYSVHLVKRIGGSYFGMRDVRIDVPHLVYLVIDLSVIQKADICSNVH